MAPARSGSTSGSPPGWRQTEAWSSRSCAGTAPVRVRPELTTPAAQQAYRKLAAAVEGRKAAELKEAIAQGQAAGLADFELRQARDALSLMNTQRCVNTAAACEQRACAVMKKALASSLDPRATATPAQIEALRNATPAQI